jgi:putative addiction module killer protein
MKSFQIRQTVEFTEWLTGLKDSMTRMRLSRRLEKASRGNFGDCKSVGDDVVEMREHFGPGWRMYFVERNGELIVMLGGGDKSSQTRDIKDAKALAKRLEG